MTPLETPKRRIRVSPDQFASEDAHGRLHADDKDHGHKGGTYLPSKHRTFAGIDVEIENPVGSVRSGKSRDGKRWSVVMRHPYGFIKRATGADGEGLDVFLGNNPNAKNAYVIHQDDPHTGKYDEDKVILGVGSPEAAKAMYLSSYNTPKFYRSMTIIPMDQFRKMLTSAEPGSVHWKRKQGRPLEAAAMFAADDKGELHWRMLGAEGPDSEGKKHGGSPHLIRSSDGMIMDERDGKPGKLAGKTVGELKKKDGAVIPPQSAASLVPSPAEVERKESVPETKGDPTKEERVHGRKVAGKSAGFTRPGKDVAVGEVFRRKNGQRYVVTEVEKPDYVTEDEIEDQDAWSQYPSGPGHYTSFTAVPVESTDDEKKADSSRKSAGAAIGELRSTPWTGSTHHYDMPAGFGRNPDNIYEIPNERPGSMATPNSIYFPDEDPNHGAVISNYEYDFGNHYHHYPPEAAKKIRETVLQAGLQSRGEKERKKKEEDERRAEAIKRDAEERAKREAERKTEPSKHKINRSALPPAPSPRQPQPSSGTATYKGKPYKLLWSGPTKYGKRAKLGFMDGSKEFWVDLSQVRTSNYSADDGTEVVFWCGDEPLTGMDRLKIRIALARETSPCEPDLNFEAGEHEGDPNWGWRTLGAHTPHRHRALINLKTGEIGSGHFQGMNVKDLHDAKKVKEHVTKTRRNLLSLEAVPKPTHEEDADEMVQGARDAKKGKDTLSDQDVSDVFPDVEMEPEKPSPQRPSPESQPGKNRPFDYDHMEQGLENVPEYARDEINNRYAMAKRLGVVDKIADLSISGRMTADQVVSHLPDVQLKPFEKKEMIRGVRAKLGIPSQDDATEFEKFRSDFLAKRNSMEGQTPAEPKQNPALRKWLSREGGVPPAAPVQSERKPGTPPPLPRKPFAEQLNATRAKMMERMGKKPAQPPALPQGKQSQPGRIPQPAGRIPPPPMAKTAPAPNIVPPANALPNPVAGIPPQAPNSPATEPIELQQELQDAAKSGRLEIPLPAGHPIPAELAEAYKWIGAREGINVGDFQIDPDTGHAVAVVSQGQKPTEPVKIPPNWMDQPGEGVIRKFPDSKPAEQPISPPSEKSEPSELPQDADASGESGESHGIPHPEHPLLDVSTGKPIEEPEPTPEELAQQNPQQPVPPEQQIAPNAPMPEHSGQMPNAPQSQPAALPANPAEPVSVAGTPGGLPYSQTGTEAIPPQPTPAGMPPTDLHHKMVDLMRTMVDHHAGNHPERPAQVEPGVTPNPIAESATQAAQAAPGLQQKEPDAGSAALPTASPNSAQPTPVGKAAKPTVQGQQPSGSGSISPIGTPADASGPISGSDPEPSDPVADAVQELHSKNKEKPDGTADLRREPSNPSVQTSDVRDVPVSPATSPAGQVQSSGAGSIPSSPPQPPPAPSQEGLAGAKDQPPVVPPATPPVAQGKPDQPKRPTIEQFRAAKRKAEASGLKGHKAYDSAVQSVGAPPGAEHAKPVKLPPSQTPQSAAPTPRKASPETTAPTQPKSDALKQRDAIAKRKAGEQPKEPNGKQAAKPEARPAPEAKHSSAGPSDSGTPAKKNDSADSVPPVLASRPPPEEPAPAHDPEQPAVPAGQQADDQPGSAAEEATEPTQAHEESAFDKTIAPQPAPRQYSRSTQPPIEQRERQAYRQSQRIPEGEYPEVPAGHEMEPDSFHHYLKQNVDPDVTPLQADEEHRRVVGQAIENGEEVPDHIRAHHGFPTAEEESQSTRRHLPTDEQVEAARKEHGASKATPPATPMAKLKARIRKNAPQPSSPTNEASIDAAIKGGAKPSHDIKLQSEGAHVGWAARINGLDSGKDFKRQFLKGKPSGGGSRTFSLDKDGTYEINTPEKAKTGERTFVQVKDGVVTPTTMGDVQKSYLPQGATGYGYGGKAKPVVPSMPGEPAPVKTGMEKLKGKIKGNATTNAEPPRVQGPPAPEPVATPTPPSTKPPTLADMKARIKKNATAPAIPSAQPSVPKFMMPGHKKEVERLQAEIDKSNKLVAQHEKTLAEAEPKYDQPAIDAARMGADQERLAASRAQAQINAIHRPYLEKEAKAKKAPVASPATPANQASRDSASAPNHANRVSRVPADVLRRYAAMPPERQAKMRDAFGHGGDDAGLHAAITKAHESLPQDNFSAKSSFGSRNRELSFA